MNRPRPKGLNITASHVLAGGLVASVVLLLIGAVLAISGRGPSVPSVTSITDMTMAIAAL
jgi:hypothetical protein